MAKLVSATYGDALFDIAVEQNQVDALYEEAGAVLTAFSENDELKSFLSHPKIIKEDKIHTIEKIFSQFVSKELTGLLVTVVTKDRSSEIESILTYFMDRVREYQKIGTAYVTTPMPLTEGQKAKVKAKLLETTAYKDFEMVYAVDESLIGGMIIRIGDHIVDSSIKTKLSRLTRELNKIDV